MQIRPLDAVTDRALVDAFFAASADYVRLERGEEPGPDCATEYFTDAPPGCDLAASLHMGLFDSGLIGIAEMSFGFPTPTDAYLGLMMIAPAARGTGAGVWLLRHMEAAGRSHGAQRLCLAVLEVNPRGRAFWQREGFAATGHSGQVSFGPRTQVAHRLAKLL